MPRIIVRGATTALTRRTTLRKAFLAPWHPLVDNCFLYSLADAQRNTQVEVHHAIANINHHHSTATPTKDNFPEFTHRFHHDLSCSLQELLREHHYDVPGELFDGRPTFMMRLLDAEAQASQLVYERLNACAAGLVKRPEHFPMRSLDFGRWKIGYIDVPRPPVYFGRDRPEVLRLELTPPPLLYRAFGGDLEKLIYHMNELVEDGLSALHAVQSVPVMGARSVKRIHPWSEPRTFREAPGAGVPTFRIGATGIVAREQRIHGAREVRHFRHEHERSRIARRDGELERRFPLGTYAMRRHHGAPVEPTPIDDALVTAPGPTFADVQRELARERVDEERTKENRHAIVTTVRQAFEDEASEIVEYSRIDLRDAQPGASKRPTSNGRDEPAVEERRGEPPPVVVRYSNDKRRAVNAPRIITLRDQRRGRPPRGRSGKRSSDPPG